MMEISVSIGNNIVNKSPIQPSYHKDVSFDSTISERILITDLLASVFLVVLSFVLTDTDEFVILFVALLFIEIGVILKGFLVVL